MTRTDLHRHGRHLRRALIVSLTLPSLAAAQEASPPPLGTASTPAPPPAPAAPPEPPFRLLSSGVTFGVGLALQWGSTLYTSRARQDVAATTFMPYVHFAPWFWVDRSKANECAAQGMRRTVPAGASPGADCLPYRFGFVIGKPLEYDAQTTIAHEASEEMRRAVHPIVLLGIGYTPIAAVSFMTGWTLSRVTRADGQDVGIGAVTLAVGINADFFRSAL